LWIITGLVWLLGKTKKKPETNMPDSLTLMCKEDIKKLAAVSLRHVQLQVI